MLSNDVIPQSMRQRIEQIVTGLMEEYPFFKEDIDYSEMVKYLTLVFGQNLPVAEFNRIPDGQLKEQCSLIMATEMLSKIGDELSPAQMAIFDEAVQGG
ncbi:hypothetical protein NG799_05035 [Laspinema sp. D1]|uniref:Late competence development protein ComFB n=1 Tax=Laspinema palackyanum D2a TaxID=2953684 RepID=A0ABT2MLU1_9CYAN|nr:hypothetical protein [Laspinema sp. D2a]